MHRRQTTAKERSDLLYKIANAIEVQTHTILTGFKALRTADFIHFRPCSFS
jgi:hypothetical protein